MASARLLVVDNSLDHDLYRPVEHWAEMVGFSPDAVHAPGGDELPPAGLYSHVIITGCEGSITELPDWAIAESAWLKDVIDSGTAVLGSCWGHQLIAVTLAGPQSVRRAAQPEFGWVEIQIADGGSLLPNGMLQTFTSHFDEVIAGCHPDLRVLAGTASCEVQAARWGDRPVWGIQPHPEISPENGTAFLRKAAEQWPDSAERLNAALAGPVLDSGAGKPIAERFLSMRP